MPILSGNIAETIDITENGQYNIARYTLANIKTPLARYHITEDGTLEGISVIDLDDFSKVITIEEHGLDSYYKNNTNLTGSISFPKLTTINESGMYSTFDGCTNLNELLPFSELTTINESGMYSTFYDCTNLTGSISFPELTEISEKGMYYAFSGCTSLNGSISFPKLTTIENDSAMCLAFRNCSNITTVSFPKLTKINGKACFYSIFEGCTNLTSVDLSKLNSITQNSTGSSNYGILSYVFEKCSKLQTVNLDSLVSITNLTTSVTVSYQPLYRAFYQCSSLEKLNFTSLTTLDGQRCLINAFEESNIKSIKFPSLSTVNNDTCFNNMLKGVKDCTVVFPVSLENTIGSWSDVMNGFGGTNTTVLFANVKELPITIQSGYTVYLNGVEIHDGESVDFIIGNNLIDVIGESSAGEYNFVVDNSTQEFILDITQIQYNSPIHITCSNAPNATFEIIPWSVNLSRYLNELQLDSSGYIQLDNNFTVDIYADSHDDSIYIWSYQGINYDVDLATSPAQTTYLNPSDIINLSSYQCSEGGTSEQYYSEDFENNELVVHNDESKTLYYSAAVALDIPEEWYDGNDHNFIIETEARVSSEANYDYGYLAITSGQILPTYQNVKNNVIPGGYTGEYIFRQSGIYDEFTRINAFMTFNSNDGRFYSVLDVGWAQDYQLKGTNSLYVKPIKIKFILDQ